MCYYIGSLSWVDDRVSRNRDEESPDSAGRDAGQHPGAATLWKVQQKADYNAPRVVQVKRCGKSAPVPVVTSGAWQTPSGARLNRRTLQARPPRPRVKPLEVGGNIDPR